MNNNKGNLMVGSIILISTVIIIGGLVVTSNNYKKDISSNEVMLNTSIIDTKKQDSIKIENEIKPEILTNEKSIKVIPEKKEITDNPDVEDISKEFILDVPFFPQAPDGDWSLPWSEACEESSIILAYHFIKGDNLTKDAFKNDVLAIVELEKEILGKYIDTNIDETAQILEKYYNYKNYEILKNPTINDLKTELLEGHPVVVPLAGKKLGNIFFKNGGPRYHMLVIVGYDESSFITNDVGTYRGKNFKYSYETIMNSLQDLTSDGEFETSDEKNKVLIFK